MIQFHPGAGLAGLGHPGSGEVNDDLVTHLHLPCLKPVVMIRPLNALAVNVSETNIDDERGILVRHAEMIKASAHDTIPEPGRAAVRGRFELFISAHDYQSAMD
jgi:hypothetical protein